MICPTGSFVDCAGVFLLVIPGRATWREPGIHNHDREYGFRLALCAPRNDEKGIMTIGMTAMRPPQVTQRPG